MISFLLLSVYLFTNMAGKKKYEDVKNVIEEVTLIKVEKSYNFNEKKKYFFNVKVSGIEELLLIESNELLDNGLVGSSIEYKLDKETGSITDFDII